MFSAGDRVTYVGGMVEVVGMVGTVKGPGTGPGRVTVHWPKVRGVLDMPDSVLKKSEGEKKVPQIKMDILEVNGIQEYADRSIDVHVKERVRGDIVLRMQEDEARWFFASMADIVKRWRSEDGDDD